MAPSKKPTSDAAFLIAAYDQLGDVSFTHAVSVGFSIAPTGRRGVFVVRTRAVRSLPNTGLRVVAEVCAEFPNSQNGSWTAFLWAQVNRLDRELTEGGSVAERAVQAG